MADVPEHADSMTGLGAASDRGHIPEEAKPVRRVGWLEVLALVLLVILADVTIYRGQGYAGLAAFVLLGPLFLLLGSHRVPRTLLSAFLACLLLLAGLKLIWSGTPLLAVYGFLLVVAFAMEIAGLTPYVLDLLAFVLHLFKAGSLRLGDYFSALKNTRWMIPRATLLQYGLPLAAVFCFGGIFVLANPDVSKVAGEWLSRFSDFLADSFAQFAPSFSEILFWLVMAWIFAGLFCPRMSRSVLAKWDKTLVYPLDDDKTPEPAAIFPAYANTLAAVIALFAIYLVFEFQTLWVMEFPPGFYYSGYAHEGAAWLTIALALATLLLSVMFRGEVLNDPRLAKLKRLAWIWSALNLVLAVAVYHRLLIYVGFNGMTRMRTVGFLGITAVVAGFLLVVRKILSGQDFVWLIRRQLWVLAFAGLLYALLPVDGLVHRYNVRRILAGDPAPSVQISVHPLDSGGMMELFPLLESEDEIIREGVRAMLAQQALDLGSPVDRSPRRKSPFQSARRSEVRTTVDRQKPQGWTSFQWADWVLARRLEDANELWSIYEEAEPRHQALERFHSYAYQWY
jgi:hypothetical protein